MLELSVIFRLILVSSILFFHKEKVTSVQSLMLQSPLYIKDSCADKEPAVSAHGPYTNSDS